MAEDQEVQLYPDGYADPERKPLLPQSQAEIMAGRLMLSDKKLRFPKNLQECVVGPMTAGEIGWLKTPIRIRSGLWAP